MIVHLVDGTYELFRHFYGFRRSNLPDQPLGAVAGVLFGTYYGVAQYTMGSILGLKAFSAAVLGGIGNIPGAMLGGFLLGEIESVGPTLFLSGLGVPSATQIQGVIAFTVLVFVLLFRPSGLLGERVTRQRA